MRSMTGSIDPASRPHTSRWEERNARRQESKRLAMEAAIARSRRNRKSVAERVELAKARLTGTTVAQAIAIIQGVSSADYDIYMLAEEFGQNRRGVLKQFGPPRNSVRTEYLAGAGLGSPEYTPDEGVEE